MKITALEVRGFKQSHSPFAMLTAYDFFTAQALDEAGIPILLVGDTLGIFVLGYETTIPVTIEDILHHCRPVARAVTNALVVGDMPFGAYGASTADGLRNALRLVKEGGAHAVKLEGPFFGLVRAISAVGIPVMGHLGLTPQSFHKLGGNKVQARTGTEVDHLIEEAKRLEAAGAFAIVLEAVPVEAARRVTEALQIPTIGIGAGPYCDGQVLVSTEMLGLSSGRRPRYAKLYAGLRAEIIRASTQFLEEVKAGTYPGSEYAYDWALR